MSAFIIRRSLLAIYIVFLIVTAGFIGILMFEGVLDKDGAVAATTRYVGGGGSGNYSKIQDAIDAASDGDTIRVFAGNYNGSVVIDKMISLIGNGSTKTTINGSGSGDVVRITKDWVNISGFNITNSGNEADPEFDSGIELGNVQNVTVCDNSCIYNNYGILLKTSQSNTIFNNTCNFNSNVGINLINSNSNIIENNTCNLNIYAGLYLDKSDSNTIENNTLISNYIYGIWCYRSDLNTLKNNSCKFNKWSGIYLYESESNNLKRNTCNFNNHNGILFYLSNSNTIENNICEYNDIFNMQLYLSDSTIIIDNSCISTNGQGIAILACVSNTILNNEMTSCGLFLDGTDLKYWNTHDISTTNKVNNKPVYYWKNRVGGTISTSNKDPGQVLLANCSNILIEDLDLNNGPLAIEVGYSSSNTISNNLFSNNPYGILLYMCSSNTITNNHCNSNSYNGIWLVDSDQNTVINNICESNDLFGLFIYRCDNNTIINNTFSSNINHGIYLSSSQGNIIQNNSVSENQYDGISINESDHNTIINNNIILNNENGIHILKSDNNRLYYNNIVNNANQAIDTAGINNLWHNDQYEGNYWSDYSGLDNGANDRIVGDGIGDTNIPHLGLDNFPFMNQSGWVFPGIPRVLVPILDSTEFDSDGNYTISWNFNRGTEWYILEEKYHHNLQLISSTEVYNGSEFAYQAYNKPNGTYDYRLKAYSGHYESDWSNNVKVIVDWPPNIPENLNASVYPAGNALNISWDLNLIDTIEYDLYYKDKADGPWKLIDTFEHPIQSYDDTGLQDGKTYYYELQARDARNQLSKFSEIVTATPADSMAPVPPTGLAMVEISFDWINLTWESNIENDIKGYHIYQENRSKLIDPWDMIGTTQFGKNYYIITGLKERTEYRFVITAFDEIPNNSTYSNWVSVTTLLGPHGPEINTSYFTSLGINAK